MKRIEDCTNCQHFEQDETRKNNSMGVWVKKKKPCDDCFYINVKSHWEKKK